MKVSYRVDTFKDFNGDLRHFVIAAVSLPTTALVEEFDNDDEYAFEAEYTEDCGKVLLLGFSACQSSDAFDEEIGKRIAKLKSLMKFNHYKEMLIYSVIPNTKDVTEHLYKAAWYAHQKQEEQWNEILSYIGQKGQEDSTCRQFGDL
jgi:hypothetical protein